ncbi:MAG: PDGLE domain-containing protein [Actinomycetota bacterium]|jgi:high-affinity Fe2+/Pb2+ permease|nr:PDGLE domain-containing protein [Actinomycetota bacterium]MDQ3382280.1 PDGLE domain-containing protein [Actinomycetota bacterium]MDQ3526437.1 PDGLE domain-containing protein [Actinomycetota bacterium]
MSTRTATDPARRTSLRVVVIVGLLVSVLLAAGVSFYASANPDGLEYVAEQVGFIESAEDSEAAGSPLADYGTEGVADERASTALAGVAGVAVTAVLAFGLMFALRRRSRGEDEQR